MSEFLVKTMPSGKDFYGKSKIHVLKYTYGQLLKIAESTDFATDIREILKGIISDFDLTDKYNGLVFADFKYLTLYRRLTVPEFEKFTVEFPCSRCGKKQSFISQISDIRFTDNPFTEEGSELGFPIRINYGEGEEDYLEFVPLTVGMVLYLLDEELDADNKINRLAVMVVNKSFDEAIEIIEGITDTSIMEAFDEIMALLDWKMEPMKRTCNNKECKHTNYVDIDSSQVLLHPKGSSKVPARDRVLYGNRKTLHGKPS